MDPKYQPVSQASDEELISPDFLHVENLQKQLRATRIIKLWAQVFGLLTIVLFFSNIYVMINSKKAVNLQDGLYPHIVPPMPLQTIDFVEKIIYASPPSEESDRAWDALLPPGRGYVFVNDGVKHGIHEAGELTSYGEIYSVAVFHQLHCLGMLRNNYWAMLEKALNGAPDLKEFAARHRHNHHANHCFDYLRQALQCGGDMTLEWPRTEKDGSRRGVDGWGVPHLCKSWDSIMQYMDVNHFNASKRTDISGD